MIADGVVTSFYGYQNTPTVAFTPEQACYMLQILFPSFILIFSDCIKNTNLCFSNAL